MSKKNVEIRGYVGGCGGGEFSLYGTSGIRRIIHHDTRRLDFIPAGTIVSCVARPVNFLRIGFELKSIRVSDYKAKRAAGSKYFLNPWSYAFQSIEHKLAAFVNKDGKFDARAINSFDSDLWDWFTDIRFLDLKAMRHNYTVLTQLKFVADIKAFMNAIDAEIAFREKDLDLWENN